jgi:hypothetical protein
MMFKDNKRRSRPDINVISMTGIERGIIILYEDPKDEAMMPKMYIFILLCMSLTISIWLLRR